LGDIIGGVIGGVGSLLGGNKGSKQALTGYNYLTGSPIGQQYLPTGGTANNMQAQLLGAAPLQAGTSNAFQNYLGSTGYNFQLQQGQNAITSSQASQGLLNSGATGKALERFGQGLGGQYFNNYLGQLGTLSNQGLQAGQQIGSAGTVGGGTAGQISQGGISSGFNQLGGAVNAGISGGVFNNVFGQPNQGSALYNPSTQSYTPGPQGF
jgi:hypothetical protein